MIVSKILSAFTVVDVELLVVFSWTPAATPLVVQRDIALAHLLRSGGLPFAGASPVAHACGDVPVAVKRVGDLIYAAFAGPTDDELAAIELLATAFNVFSATCEEDCPTAARVSAFYGKVVVCLHEAFSGQGFALHTDVDSILRNSKLKSPQA